MSIRLTFLGAAGTVTGSKYLVEFPDQTGKERRVLVDAGMFQGTRAWSDKNWEDPDSRLLESVDVLLLTHAHIDHVGILPRWSRLGLGCPVLCTQPTAELAKLLLLDSAKLQEEEAAYREKEGKSRFANPQPLYRVVDAQECLKKLKPIAFHTDIELFPGVHARWTHMGHILGAAAITLTINGKVITFSGDVGRYDVPILKDPEAVEFGDLLLIESTYGDRLHPHENSIEHFAKIVRESFARKGVLLIPSFAVGRTQLLLYYLRELQEKHLIPEMPIIVDSPMADDATELYSRFPADYDEAALQILKNGKKPFEPALLHFIRDRKESIALNNIDQPMILISASGMLSGGRILHHLKHRIANPRTTLLFVGFQPPGGRGDLIKSGAHSIRILGDDIPIRATIEEMSELSAHADRKELLRWCRGSATAPGRVAIVHGEPSSAESFRGTLNKELNWNAFVAKYYETIEI